MEIQSPVDIRKIILDRGFVTEIFSVFNQGRVILFELPRTHFIFQVNIVVVTRRQHIFKIYMSVHPFTPFGKCGKFALKYRVGKRFKYNAVALSHLAE